MNVFKSQSQENQPKATTPWNNRTKEEVLLLAAEHPGPRTQDLASHQEEEAKKNERIM